VQDCRDARGACEAPARSTLAAAVAACDAAEAADTAACAGDPTCTQAAEAAAFDCRDAASTAATPGLTDCAATYRRCARACPPPASAPTADAHDARAACTLEATR
jgi:hypothetical protein